MEAEKKALEEEKVREEALHAENTKLEASVKQSACCPRGPSAPQREASGSRPCGGARGGNAPVLVPHANWLEAVAARAQRRCWRTNVLMLPDTLVLC